MSDDNNEQSVDAKALARRGTSRRAVTKCGDRRHGNVTCRTVDVETVDMESVDKELSRRGSGRRGAVDVEPVDVELVEVGKDTHTWKMVDVDMIDVGWVLEMWSKMSAVGFEPTSSKTLRPERNPLDHSGKPTRYPFNFDHFQHAYSHTPKHDRSYEQPHTLSYAVS